MARRALGPAGLQTVQAVERLRRGPLLIACSGGPDSLALAGAAAVVAARRGDRIRAVIVDHGLQPESADVAAGVVAQLQQNVKISAAVIGVDVRDDGLGPEAAARSARYAALQAAADDDEQVLLGHTMDDQAETVLLGLARGSGIRSLAGMPASRGPFVRPFLGVRRSITAAACQEFGLEPWIDPHNQDRRFTRVRVRAEVIPTLEDQLGPGVTEALARSAQLARADADFLDELASQAISELTGPELEVRALRALPEPIATRVLRWWLLDAGADEVTATHVQAVWGLVAEWRGQAGVDVPGLRIGRRGGHLFAVPL